MSGLGLEKEHGYPGAKVLHEWEEINSEWVKLSDWPQMQLILQEYQSSPFLNPKSLEQHMCAKES